MFERLVRQLLLGYLGQYIKDIQKEQLKITLWNEEVLLENVELILEAFDYLQLPFALKNGRIGKLSIKIPWKKLGWDPIIIILEDVFVSACQREDQEWSMDEIEKREFAGKKAKLAAAELAKLSRRVCDNSAGKSFISYITAKILDGIQVSIKNVHILYHDSLNSSAGTLLGMKFSGLTISRQNLAGLSSGKVRGGQVNKLIEVQGLELYCCTFEGTLDLINVKNIVDSKYVEESRFQGKKCVHVLSPLDVFVSLSVNRSGKLENDAPQYSVNVELSNVVMSMNEVQLQQILSLSDYLSTCRLRQRYGRYRPWWSPLDKKLKGWQIAWWHYAQESVLSDVRRGLKKTSWKYLGERLNCRRKYVRSYKTKLKFLQQDQVIDEVVLRELEEMEKASDIDDILSYRSAAERELQDLVVNSVSNCGNTATSGDKALEDERPYSKPRGWLNWLSRGMLGAGGTDDSREFSGVISDDVVKDIYEATKFHPVPSVNEDTAINDEIILSSVKFNIQQISATLRIKRLVCAIARCMLNGIFIECKILKGPAVAVATVNTIELLNPFNEQVVLSTRKMDHKENETELWQPSLTIQVDVLPLFHEDHSSVKVILQPVQMTCDSGFLMNVMEFFHFIVNFKFLHERVLSSVNEINDIEARVLSKIDYVLSSRRRMKWDMNCANLLIAIPWIDKEFKTHKVVLEVGAFNFQSKDKRVSFSSEFEDSSYHRLRSCCSSINSNGLILGSQLEDLYNNYEISISEFEVKILSPYSTDTLPILEKFSCSIHLESCVISDEPLLKALDVYISISSILFHFSPSIYHSIIELISDFSRLNHVSCSEDPNTSDGVNIQSNELHKSETFWFSIRANLESVGFRVDLENDAEHGHSLALSLQMVDVSFDQNQFPDCWISVEALKIVAYSRRNEEQYYVLCSSDIKSTAESFQLEKDIKHGLRSKNDVISSLNKKRLQLHYEAFRDTVVVCHKFAVCLANVDIHCYPSIIGLVVRFIDKILKYETSMFREVSPVEDVKRPWSGPHFDFKLFGFSNFVECGASGCEDISLDCFPFITIRNPGPLVALENSLIRHQWREIHNLRVPKVQSHKFDSKNGSRCHHNQLVKSVPNTNLFPQNSVTRKMCSIDFNASSIRLHFHDSSCVLATLCLQSCKSSMSIYDDCYDILCSSEGLVLSSSWWSQTPAGFLWGQLSPNISPILNMRIRKEHSSPTELSFSIQHVSCILYPEFLAVIMGYFSLPDWHDNVGDQPIASDKSGDCSSEHESSIFYKFEILNSVLMTPAGTDAYQFLKLDIQQMLCSFVGNSDVDLVLKGIPVECLIPSDKLSNRNHCLNLFGHDLSLSLVLVNADLFDSSSCGKKSYHQDVALVAALTADVWLRFPIQNESSTVASIYPTVIMATIIDFHLDARETWTIAGYEALMNVIDQFSLVDLESNLFKSDILEFLESKKSMKKDIMHSPEEVAVAAIEIRLSVKSMTLRLHCSNRESIVSELIAEIKMQFTCSASLLNDQIFDLNISLFYFVLFSLLNSVILVEGTLSSLCSNPSSPDMILSVCDQGKNKFYMSLPCLNIWLHMLDWHEVIVLLDYYYTQLSKTLTDAAMKDTNTVADVANDISQSSVKFLSMSNSFSSDEVTDYSAVKLERVGITIYIPLEFHKDIFSMLMENQVPSEKHLSNSFNMIYQKPPGFMELSLQSGCSEIISDDNTTILKIRFEKVEGTVQIYKDSICRTWSLFHLLQMTLAAEILNQQLEHKHAKFDVYCDNLDMGLSNDIFVLYQCVQFEMPQAGSSASILFTAIDFRVQLGKLSLLLTDAKWNSSGPLLEILVRNLHFGSTITESETDGSVGGDLQANYKNMEKVFWEPLVEPWKFHLNISRKHDNSSLLDGGIVTLIHLNSISQLNLNLTESMIEIVSRAVEMIKDVLDPPEVTAYSNHMKLFDSQKSENLDNRRYAPYIIQNLTSLPLVFHVCEGEPSPDDLNALLSESGHVLEPASSVPIYVNETPEGELFCCRHAQSSDRFCGKQIVDTARHFIIIQLEGTSVPSPPISMDLVGLRYFEVDFSKPITKSIIGNTTDIPKGSKNVEADGKTDAKSGFVIPVVIDVSVHHYTKLLQLYSTVIFLNATSVPLEVRFDIPFGVSPKVLDPIYPGKEFPLPLHLAEAGRMRWRPLGETHLWSEAYNVSNIISHESRNSFLRSFVCYPSHPSSDPFRCCISVDDRYLPLVGSSKKFFLDDDGLKPSTRGCKEVSGDMETSKRFIYLVTLHSPLVLRNYLPEAVRMTMETGGITRTLLLSEEETSFFHIDSSHDLTFIFNIRGFRPSTLKFGRAEVFSAKAKFSTTKFSLSETLTFDSQSSDGPLGVTVEKVMDAFSGAREICISVPYLIYNCIGFPLVVSNSVNEIKGHNSIVPSCYDLGGHEQILGTKGGLGLLFSDLDRHKAPLDAHLTKGSLKNPSLSKSYSYECCSKALNPCGPSTNPQDEVKHDLDAGRASFSTVLNNSDSSSQSNLKSDFKSPDLLPIDCIKASPCMYSPSHSSSGEIMVRLSRCLSDAITKSIPSSLWSHPFLLVPPTGSTSVTIPQLCTNAGYLVSVSAFAAPFSGRTRIITFQPRYVISNACGRDLMYRQKGTDRAFLLGACQNSHIECTDTTRELLFCLRFREPGWQWSGSFSPEHLGDTQVKMRNYISGAVNMMRVEVQSADVFKDDKIARSPHGNSGTNLILVTDDDTGFMPYRIDNFSKERLRIYQQRCENFETIVHSYTSHTYAWDEPCFPHRLTVEVPGERIIGSYTLDEVKDYSPVYLPATFEIYVCSTHVDCAGIRDSSEPVKQLMDALTLSELLRSKLLETSPTASQKPERTLVLSVHSEGAIKVLSIIDSSYHLPTSDAPQFKHTRKHAQKGEMSVHYNERLLVDIPFIGVSLMNSYAEELLFACAKNTRFDFVQSLDQQKLSLQISFLQIDNQLTNTPYPVILSFDHGNKGNKEDRRKVSSVMQIDSNSLPEPVFSLSMAKWRSKNLSLVSLEHVNLRVAEFHLELEQEVILSLFEFFKKMSLRFQYGVWQQTEFSLYPFSADLPEFFKSSGNQLFSSSLSLFHEDPKKGCLLPEVIPIGAPWQQIHLLVRKQKKIYVEVLDLAPINFTLSFSSSPWTLRNGVLTSGESLIHRGLMALADIEGAQIHLKELVLSHQLASWESIQDIFVRHYTRQSLHEIYKVFGSAGLIGNPMGFARSLSLGIRDFLSVPVWNVFQSPVGLLTGMAQGTSSLLSNTVYAISDAATQFSRAAHKGIVAFTIHEKTVGQTEKQQKGISSQSKGVINEFLEGLTGLLQSPIQGAEKHGLPGVLSGIALGMTGLVAKPAASILEVTGKTAQSIRNRSKLPNTGPQRYRVRLPRPLSTEFPLKPYSWEEAVGTSVLRHSEKSMKLRDETLVSCKALMQGGKFVIITDRLILVVSCSTLIDFGKPEFKGVPANPDWVIEADIGIDSIIHATNDDNVVHIVGSNIDSFFRHSQHQQKQGQSTGGKPLNHSHTLPLFQIDLECASKEEAGNLLQLVQSTVKKGKCQGGWGRTYILHQSNLR